jgi:hypothetical protein
MFFPVVALGMLVWFGCKALADMKIAKFVAAPFVGLAAIVLMPFAGIVTLAWVAAGGEMPAALALKLAVA